MHGVDPGVVCLCHAAFTLWLLGYPDQALQRIHETLALAQELAHPYSLAYARSAAALVSQYRQDVPAVHEQAEATVVLSTDCRYGHDVLVEYRTEDAPVTVAAHRRLPLRQLSLDT